MKTLLNLASIFGVFCLCGAPSHGQGSPTNALPARVNFLVIPLDDATGDPDEKHWQSVIDSSFRGRLREVKAIHILPESTFSFAARMNGFSKSQRSFNPDERRALGRSAGADKVVSIAYSKAAGKWVLTAGLTDVVSGSISSNTVATSTNWMEIVPAIAEQITKETGVNISDDERTKIYRSPTMSPKALEMVSRAIDKHEHGGSISQLEETLRQALKEDPKFEYASLALAQALGMQNKVSEAIEAVETSIKLRPDYAYGHELLGVILATSGRETEARAQFHEALHFDPESLESYIRLSEIDGIRADRAGAIANLKKAKELAPHDSSVLAHLAAAYARNGDLNEARAEIKLAEIDADLEVYRRIGETYDLLKDFPSAVHYYEQVLAYADARGIRMTGLEIMRERVEELKPTLTPHYVKATPPKVFTKEEVMQACRTTLSTNEFALVVNPLESNAEMKRWAQELVAGTTNQFDTAHKLFLGITKHINYPNSTGTNRTAIEAFNEWNNLRARFNCQDYTYLLVVLAREVGLKAFFVAVEKDSRGRPVTHACAGIFVDGKALLVDPAFRWFGAAHQAYQFKDDREVVALFLSQLSSVEACGIAVKLLPDNPFVRFNYAMDLAQAGKSKAAEEALDEALKLDSTSWLAHNARGMVAVFDSRWRDAEMQFRDALDENPEYPKLHFFFGMTLVNEGKYGEAMKELQKYLDEGDVDEELAKQAREHIKKITDSHALLEGK